jgi:ABC-type uncharacterized transport system ATPase subunit
MITHKFREVMAFADDVTVLRRGKLIGTGRWRDATPDSWPQAMVGDAKPRQSSPKARGTRATPAEAPPAGSSKG